MFKKIALLVSPIFFLCIALAAAFSGPALHTQVMPIPPAGHIYAVSPASTFWGMIQAVQQSPGTFIMAKGDMLMFSWPIPDGAQAYTMLNGSIPSAAVPNFIDEAGGRGNLIRISDMKDLVSCLKQNGWKTITAGSIPQVIKIAIVQGYTWMISLADKLPTFIFVPGISVEKMKIIATPILN